MLSIGPPMSNSGLAGTRAAAARAQRDRFPSLTLLKITDVARDWDDAQQRFFAENGLIDTVYKPKPR